MGVRLSDDDFLSVLEVDALSRHVHNPSLHVVCLTAVGSGAAQAYGAYIVHLLLMLVLQNVVDGIWMGAFGKFMFIGVVITIASFGLTWLQRMIPGVKKVL